jgi:hypothetical protein
MEVGVTILSRRVFLPHAGKRDIVIDRLKTVAGAINRAGGEPLLMNISYGHMAGQLALFGLYSDFVSATSATVKMASDAELQKVNKLRESDRAADFVGPDVLRVVFGEARPQSTMMVRTYQVDRNNLTEAVGILHKVYALMQKSDEPGTVTGIVPMISDNMDRLNVIYGFDNMEHMGRAVQNIGLSTEFQELVNEANRTGKLVSVRVQQRIDL